MWLSSSAVPCESSVYIKKFSLYLGNYMVVHRCV